MRKSARACGRTALANGLDAAGYIFPAHQGQAEDALFDFIQTDPECRALYMAKPAAARKDNPIEEWQDILALGANRWLGKNACVFFEHASVQKVFDHVTKKGPCVVTGAFPTLLGTLSHSVVILGVEWVEALRRIISHWFINDPWGDHRTFYRAIRGKHVLLTHEEYLRILYANNSEYKWCIAISKEGL
jgi:hypothetical protein